MKRKQRMASVSMGVEATSGFRGVRMESDKVRIMPRTDDVKVGNYNLKKMRRKILRLEDAVESLIGRLEILEAERKSRQTPLQNSYNSGHEGVPVISR